MRRIIPLKFCNITHKYGKIGLFYIYYGSFKVTFAHITIKYEEMY